MRKPKLKIGNKVRISKNRRAFAKSHLPGWTEELFIVHQAYSGDPPFYKIKDLNNEILDSTFYAEELQKIYKTFESFESLSIIKVFSKLKAFLKSGDERNNRSIWLSGQDIRQHLILGYLQNN